MTASEAESLVLQSGEHGDDEAVLIDIYEKLPTYELEASFSEVRVRRVPQSLRSAMPEAFTPQFVSLGPYHHSDPNLPVTSKLKLGVVKRFLRVTVEDISQVYQSLQNPELVSKMEAYYDNTVECDSRTLPSVFTVDGLFFLALLHSANEFRFFSHYCFILLGKLYPMLSVNAAEWSMDGIIRDLFIFENQIPIFVIHHIIQVSSIEYLEDLNSILLDLCKAASPFDFDENLSQYPHTPDHLLDLMYSAVSPDEPLRSDLQQHRRCDFYRLFGIVMCVPISLIYLFCFGLWILLWILAYLVVVTLQPFLQFIRFILVKVIPWSAAIFGQPILQFPTLRHFFATVRDLWVYYVLNVTLFSFSLHYFYTIPHLLLELILLIRRGFLRRLSCELKRPTKASITVPSAAELNSFGIQFKRVLSDISAVKFDEKKGEFQLPCIRLHKTSQVILRNLAAYESSIVTHCSNLRSYIQLMRALVKTEADIKFLVEKKIVQTELSAEVVIQIFNMPMDGSVWWQITKEIGDLEVKLNNVKARSDAVNNLYLIFTEFVRICAICGVIVAFYPLLAEGFHKLWCSTIFATSSGSYCVGNLLGDSAGRNDHYNIITSM